MESTFNDQSNPNRKQPGPPKEHPSHEESLKKIELYQSIGFEEDHYVVYERIKAKYRADHDKTTQERSIRDINYSEGVRMHLPHSPYEIIKAVEEGRLHKIRDSALTKAKEFYRENNSLSKTFESTQRTKGHEEKER